MWLKAIIFDVDGTIADTEQNGHLPASNDAIAALGYDVQWTWEDFAALYHVPGNANRMRVTLQQMAIPPDEIEHAIAQFIGLKQQIYIDKYLPHLPLRAGVERLMHEALAADIRLAIVSSSHEAQIHALLDSKLPDLKPHFRPILGKESGLKTAPDSPLYRRCVDALRMPPDEILVIEDSEDGFQAAHRAGLTCAVIYNHLTYGRDFTGAILVARSLETFSLRQLEALCLPATSKQQ